MKILFLVVGLVSCISFTAHADVKDDLIAAQKKIIELQGPRKAVKLRFETIAPSRSECKAEIRNTLLASAGNASIQPHETFGGSSLYCRECGNSGESICREGNTYYYFIDVTLY